MVGLTLGYNSKTLMLKIAFLSILMIGSNAYLANCQIGVENLSLDTDVGQWVDQEFGIDETSLAIGITPNIKAYGKSNPLFKDGQWQHASLKYQGQVYQNIKVLYNLEEDYLAVGHPTVPDKMIKLENAALDWFELGSDLFVCLDEEVQSGIYQSLYADKNIYLYRKQSKQLEFDQSNHTKIYNSRFEYYFFSEGSFQNITKKKDIVAVFSDHRKSLKKFIRTNKLSFDQVKNATDWVRLIKFHSKWMKG